MSGTADIAVLGLAVMGENLAQNFESRGYEVALYNRTPARTDALLQGAGRGRRFIGARTLEALVASLSKPRKLFLMVKAGAPVDELLGQLAPLLEPGDIVVDGGNSLYSDTERRWKALKAQGLSFVGCGVSGGEEGALHGPSMMPGGEPAAWPALRPIFEAASARAPDGSPCVDWMGEGGAGHYVKMIHNGIEYGDMQLIAEVYDLMKRVLGFSNEQMRDIFDDWNRGELESYLIGITRDILGHRDASGVALLDVILDAAGQKGTGRWTAIEALERGAPLTLITEAVFARSLSAAKDARVIASKSLPAEGIIPYAGAPEALVADLRAALYAAKIVSYAQGFELLAAGSKEHAWQVNPGGVAQVWRGGCIIRAAFLGDIRAAYTRDGSLANLLLDPFFTRAVNERQGAWRRVVSTAALAGIPAPCLSSGLAYLDSLRTARLPANLIQAQRDYFGAHTYERLDGPRGEMHHTEWLG